jgi:hypothetical protein
MSLQYINSLIYICQICAKYRGGISHIATSSKCDVRTITRGTTVSARKPKIDVSVVEEFYCRDDNSRLTSGKKQVRCRRRGSPPCQIRYLLYSMTNLYEKFVSEFGTILSKSTFCSKRPFFVCKPKINDREQCLCMRCANLQVSCGWLWCCLWQ